MCFQRPRKLQNASPPTLTRENVCATSSVRRRSGYSTTGTPMGRMDSPSLLSSSHKQLASVSASVHFRLIISLRRQPVSAISRMMFTIVVFLTLGEIVWIENHARSS